MCKMSSNHVVLIACEAKGLDASLSACFSQAVRAACDFAVDQYQRFQLSSEDIVALFVLTSSDCFQFGVVYLVEPCYPCPVLLTVGEERKGYTGIDPHKQNIPTGNGTSDISLP